MTQNDKTDIHLLLLELSASNDVRNLIELLQVEVDKSIQSGNSKSSIAMAAGLDPSFFSRIVNGRSKNPNLLTITKIFRAIDCRLAFEAQRLEEVQPYLANFVPSSEFDTARENHLWREHTNVKTHKVMDTADAFKAKQPRVKVSQNLHFFPG